MISYTEKPSLDQFELLLQENKESEDECIQNADYPHPNQCANSVKCVRNRTVNLKSYIGIASGNLKLTEG
jgi:hypothetical protein